MKTITNGLAILLVALTLFACSEATTSTAADPVTEKAIATAKEVVKDTITEIDSKMTLNGEVENYNFDIRGKHASIMFKVNHLGYSWLHGRFNNFDGSFTYNTGNPNDSSVSVTIDTTSVDSNHAERDKHLRSPDFLDVEKFPTASFESTSVSLNNGKGAITGNLTLHGITKEIVLNVSEVGAGKDPWGGFRRGFTATTEFKMADFGITKNLGPASQVVFMELDVEGVKQTAE